MAPQIDNADDKQHIKMLDRQHGHLNRRANQPVLAVKRKLWRRDDDHASINDAAFTDLRSGVLRRDNYSCRFCTFQASKYQEVHHLDDDHSNNTLDNLITACTLCHQVHHLGMCGLRNGGFMAAIPELTQTEVNTICRAIYVADLTETQPIRDKLRSIMAIFEHRGSDTLKGIYGTDISEPLTWAQILSDMPDELYEKRADILGPLRLVPTKEAFHAGQLEYYAANNTARFKADQWKAFHKQLAA